MCWVLELPYNRLGGVRKYLYGPNLFLSYLFSHLFRIKFIFAFATTLGGIHKRNPIRSHLIHPFVILPITHQP